MSISSHKRQQRRLHPILAGAHSQEHPMGACQLLQSNSGHANSASLVSVAAAAAAAAATNRSLGSSVQRLVAHEHYAHSHHSHKHKHNQHQSKYHDDQQQHLRDDVAQLAPNFNAPSAILMMNHHHQKQQHHQSQNAQQLLLLDPQATAQAMVGAARATLVILMGVLVTKLILTSKKESTSSSSNQSGRFRRAGSQSDSSAPNNNNIIQSNISSQFYSSYYSSQERLPEQLPPGPRGLPLVGYLPFLGSELHVSLTQLSEKFGPIYQIFLGSIRVVVLTDASLVRQAFRQPVFSGRPDTQLTRILQGYGIVNSDGALWREQRAFVHSALRKLGLKSLMNGSNGLEAKIQKQVCEFVDDLSQQAASAAKTIELRPFVARSVSSVVGSIVMNSIYQMDDEKKFDRLMELMEEGFKLFAIAMPLDFIPILRFLPNLSWAYKKIKQNRHETSAFFNEFADQHRKYLSETYNLRFNKLGSAEQQLHPKAPEHSITGQTTNYATKHDNDSLKTTDAHSDSPDAPDANQVKQLDNIVARDLVDAYIIQQKRHEADGKQSYFSDQQLIQIMSDIFSAGLETVTSTIDWSILFMILNPKCQKRVQAEIDRVIGRERQAELNDLTKMPYTEATIFEVLRRSNVVPLGNAHATLEDASIGGFMIPKGTQVLPNLYGMNMNAKLWSKPDDFEPTRFLIANQERAQKPDHFIPFSVGRRVCLGDLLAKMEVFLFLVGLLQRFDLSVAPQDSAKPPRVEGTIGLSNAPVPYRVSISLRAPATTTNGEPDQC